MFKKILVAVDGSKNGLKAAHTAAEIARSMESDLWVVTAYDRVPAYLGEPNLQKAITERLSQAKQVMDRALQEIDTIPGKIITETLEGPAAEAILSVIEARQIDLVVMGTRGLGELAGLLLGSQSHKVVQHATCPVLLVR